MRPQLLTALLVAGALTCAPAAAATYTYTADTPRSGGSAGPFSGVSIAYDEGGDAASPDPTLSFGATLTANPANGPVTGGWLVVSPGGDPKLTNDQLAILYLDFASGDVTAYRYDGTLGTDGVRSFEDASSFIGTYADAIDVTVMGSTLTFSVDALDVADIQAASDADGFTGVAFGETIGIWLHLGYLREYEQNADGSLAAFRLGQQSWFDLPSGPTDDLGAVPLPGGLVLAGTGLAALGAARRKAKRG